MTDAWGRVWGDPAFGQHPGMGGTSLSDGTPSGFDYWGRPWGHADFGQAPYGGPGGPVGHASELLPGNVPATPQTGTIPRVGQIMGQPGAIRSANPGLPDVFEPAERSHARHPSWNPAGLDAQQLPYRMRDKMAQNVHYYQAPNRIQFILPDPPEPGVVGRAQIQPPTFDMRPDLRNVGPGNRPETSVPIWRESAFGQGLYLFIKIHGLIVDVNVDMKVYSIQFGDPGREDLVTPLQEPEEITQDFFDGANGVILSWPTPLFRFWRVELRFDQLTGPLNQIGPPGGLSYSVAVY